MRSEVPTLVTIRITIFEHMTSCHLLETDKHFEGTGCLQFQSRICRQQFSPNVLLLYRPLLVQSRHVFHSLRLIIVMFCNSGIQVRTATVASVNTVLYTPVCHRICILCVTYCPWAEKQWFNWMMVL